MTKKELKNYLQRNYKIETTKETKRELEEILFDELIKDYDYNEDDAMEEYQYLLS